MTRITVSALFTRNGCEVVEAENAADARTELDRHDVDLVVCDYEMPGLNGGELRVELGAEYATPFVLLTGFGGEAEISGLPGVELVDAVLTKPIGSSSISDLVERFLTEESTSA